MAMEKYGMLVVFSTLIYPKNMIDLHAFSI